MFDIHGGNKIENLCYLYFLHKHLCKFLFGDESILVDVKESESDVGRVFPFPALSRRLNLSHRSQLELVRMSNADHKTIMLCA